MAIKNIEQQFKQTNMRLNQFETHNQINLKTNTNPLLLMLYKVNSKLESITAFLDVLILPLFIVQTLVFGNDQLKFPLAAISVIIISLVLIHVLINCSLFRHLNKYKMKAYTINNEYDENYVSNLTTKFFTKKQIEQLWQHGYNLLVAYRKANYNLKALPTEWQWLNKKHYDIMTKDYDCNFTITKNGLVVAYMSVNSLNYRLILWDIKNKQKFHQIFSKQFIATIALTIVAIITLIIGCSSTILLSLSTISSFFAAVCILYSSEFDDDQLADYYHELDKNKITVPKKSKLIINYFANSKRI